MRALKLGNVSLTTMIATPVIASIAAAVTMGPMHRDHGHQDIAVVTFRLGHQTHNGVASAIRQQNAIYHVARGRLAGYRAADDPNKQQAGRQRLSATDRAAPDSPRK